MPEPRRPPSSGLRGTLARHALFFGVAYVLVSLCFWAFHTWYWAPRHLQNSLPQKLAHYESNAAHYNVLFLGDSRTYCGIHPHLLDPYLGTRSYNLSSFANWFPTQYPLVQDLLPALPKNTLVVWSVGHQNFFENPGIHPRYPIGLRNLPRYLGWGFPVTGLWENIAAFNPLLQLYAQRGAIFDALLGRLERPLWRAPLLDAAQSEVSPLLRKAQELRRRYKSDPKVAEIEIVKDAGRPTSVVLFTTRGSYVRQELDPEYFRRMQRDQSIPGNRPLPPAEGSALQTKPDPRYWNLFLAMLDLFQQAGTRLVVSEFEEAPYCYPTQQTREHYRDFMRTVVQREVERRGFGYLRVDFERLHSEHYFDYNHLNMAGAAVFTPMLAAALRPFLPPAPSKD